MKNENFRLYTEIKLDVDGVLKNAKAMRQVLMSVGDQIAKQKDKIAKMYKEADKWTDSQIKEAETRLDTLKKQYAVQQKATKQQINDLSMLRRAQDDMDKMSLRQLNDALRQARKKMQSLGGDKHSQKELQGTVELMEKLDARIKSINIGFKNAYEAAKKGTKMSIPAMEDLLKMLESEAASIAKNDKEYKSILETAQKLKMGLANRKGFDSVEKFLNKGKGNATDAQLAAYKKFYEGIASSANSSASQVENALAKIEKVNEELSKRTKADITSNGSALTSRVNAGTFVGTIDETKEAIKQLEKFRGTLNADEKSVLQVSKALTTLNEKLNAVKSETIEKNIRLAQTDIFLNRTDKSAATDQNIKEYIDYYKDISKSATSTAAEVEDATKKMKKAQEELEQRSIKATQKGGIELLTKIQGGAFMGSVDKTNEAIEQLKKFRGTLDTVGEGAKKIREVDDAISILKDRIDSLDKERIEKLDRLALVDSDMNSATAPQLKEYKKFYEDIANSANSSAAEIEEASQKIENAQHKLAEIERSKTKEVATGILEKIDDEEFEGTIANTKEAIEQLNKYRDLLKATGEDSNEIYRVDEAIEELTEDLKSLNKEFIDKQDRLYDVKTALLSGDTSYKTNADIKEFKKYYEDIALSAKSSASEVQEAAEMIKLANDELNKRAQADAKTQGQDLLVKLKSGFEGTIAEAKDAIEVLKKFRETLNVSTEVETIKDVDSAINDLNSKIANVSENVNVAIDGLDKFLENGTLPDTAEGLESMKQSLKEYAKIIHKTDPKRLVAIRNTITAIDKEQKKLNKASIDWEEFMSNLNTKSLKELKEAYKDLEESISTLSPSQEEYNKEAAKMKEIDGRLKELTKSTKEYASTFENALDRLKNYFVIYMGFDKFLDLAHSGWSNIVKLSDEMTNVQKVTGMSADEIDRMTDSIQNLNTRVNNSELMQLAEQAGKLGINSANSVTQFVSAGQTITSTLSEIGGAETVTQLLKISELVNKNSGMSIEESLNRIGSAILNVGNNSKAGYKDVSEFTRRLGAVGATSKLTMPQIMALGGTVSALGGDIEASSTALQRVLIGLQTNTKKVAQAVGMSFETLDNYLSNGETFKALYIVLENLRGKGVQVIDEFMSAIGGKNSQQSKAALTAITEDLGVLKRQLALAENGYKNGKIAIQEFDKANNNLAGTIEQINNEFSEMIANSSTSNGALTNLAGGVLFLVRAIKDFHIAAGTMIGIISGLVLQLGKVTVTALRTGDALKKLRILMSTNWVTAAATAIGVLATAAFNLLEQYNNLKKAIGEVNEEHDREMSELIRLHSELRKYTNECEERTQAITEFNQKFGSYLTNLLDEENVVNRLAIAYNEAAEAINNKTAKQIEDNAAQEARDEFKEDMTKTSGKMEDVFNKTLPENQETNAQAASDLRGVILARLQELERMGEALPSKDDVMSFVQERFRGDERFERMVTYGKMKYKTNELFSSDYLKATVSEYIDLALKESASRRSKQRFADTYRSAAKESSRNRSKEILANVWADKYATEDDDTTIKDATYYLTHQLKDATTGSEDKVRQLLNSRLHKTNPWGTTSADWTQMGGKELANVVKYFNEIMNSHSSGKDFMSTTGYSKNLPTGVTLPEGIEYWDKDSLVNWAKQMWDKAKQVQRERNHANAEGNFTDDPKGSKDKAPKELMDATMKKLDEYYKRQEEYINMTATTEEDAARQLLANEKEHLEERINLQEKWFDKTKAFNHDYITNLFDDIKDIDWQKINSFLGLRENMGDAQGVRLNMAKDANKIQTDRKGMEKKVQSVIMGENSFLKLFDNTKKELDILELLLPGMKSDGKGGYANLEGEIQDRMSFIFKIMGNAVNMNANMLKGMMAKQDNESVFAWMYGLSDEQLDALLKRIVSFNTTYRKELRKEANEIDKQVKERLAENGFDSKYADMEGKINRNKNLYSLMEGTSQSDNVFGLNPAEDMELKLYDLKIQKSQEYIEQLKKEFEAKIENASTEEERERYREELEYKTEEHNKNIINMLNERADKQSELAFKQIEKFRPYAEMVNQFAEDFGGSIFGNKEDREKAAKALLTSFIKTTGTMLAQHLTYLATKQAADRQADAIELDAELAKKRAEMQADALKGTTSEVAKMGWLGFATGAAITAGVTALVAMLTSWINKGKSEIGVSTGKLSTGMYTYANGLYPTYADGTMVGGMTKVDGADGKTYNATYKPNLTTGEYSRPHLGIVGEKGAEVIIDHNTYMGLKNKAPHILQSIYDMHRYGRLTLDYPTLSRNASMLNGTRTTVYRNVGVRTYADGNIDSVLNTAASSMPESGASVGNNETNERLATAIELLLTRGVHINMYGDDGLYKNLQKANKFMAGK